jgi:SNF2 family DNA or RNA helicase
MKTAEFVIVLTKHRQFGWLLKPYTIQRLNKEFYTITENILAEEVDVKKYDPVQQKLIQLSTQFTEKEIIKLFSKKKTSSRDFKAALDETSLPMVRSYIEKRLIKSFEILRKSYIKVFYYADSKNLFEEDRIELVPGITSTIFNFIKEENGSKYYLSINDGEKDIRLSNRPGEIICNSPCILLASHRLYFFDEGEQGIDGKKLLPFFTKDAVLIPKSAEKKYFETFVKNSLENYRVNAVGFEVRTDKPEPIPVLIFENDWKDEFVLILKFDYHGLILSYNYDKKAFVNFHYENGSFYFTRLERNLEFEQRKRAFLLSFPELDEQNDCSYKLKEGHAVVTNLLNWINLNSLDIEKQGYIIKQNFNDRKYFTRDYAIEFRLKDGHDWFDLYATVRFGDYSFPFIALKNNILRNVREYMLPNGEIVLLPDEWFEKYSSFFHFGKSTEGALRLKKHHAAFLYEQISSIDKSVADKLTSLERFDLEKPGGLTAEFRPYQKTGYNWIYSLYKNKLGSCLADDMGLGKTVQTLASILKFYEHPVNTTFGKVQSSAVKQLSLFDNSPSTLTIETPVAEKAGLIIMPTSLIHNWVNEINKFAPGLKYLPYTGSKRVKDSSEFDAYQLILTSYGILRNDIDLLKDYFYHFIILDESQFAKNPSSRIYQSVIELQAAFKMVLTGTPIENSLVDLWAQLNFINPGLLGSLEFFRKEFADPIEKEADSEEKEIRQQRLQKLISPFILRRKKEEVLDELPDLTETIHYCSMDEEQKQLYEFEKSRIRNTLLRIMENKEQSNANIVVIQGLTKLRQLANHPKMIDPESLAGSGKFDEIINMLESVISENHKVLLFSSFVKHLDLFADTFNRLQWGYAMLTGETSEREGQIKKFQENDDCKIFLISLKAGGVGLNLTAADYVFFLDPWWNPAAENQALSRAHRIGQKNKVMVYRFISAESIEQKILKLQEKKKDLADIFINTNNPFKQLSEQEIMDLFI